MSTIADEADRTLGDMYHVMNFQRLSYSSSSSSLRFFVVVGLTLLSRHCPSDLPPQRISSYKERLELQIQGICCRLCFSSPNKKMQREFCLVNKCSGNIVTFC
jgi:hypothetical protein